MARDHIVQLAKAYRDGERAQWKAKNHGAAWLAASNACAMDCLAQTYSSWIAKATAKVKP